MARKHVPSRASKPHLQFDTLPDWLTVREASDYLRLGRDSTYALFRQQKAIRFGNMLRLPKHRLDPNGRRSNGR
jgi:excisionase family DNA binding protein